VVRWSSIFIFVLAPLIGCGFDTPVPGQSGRGSDTTAPTQPNQPTQPTKPTKPAPTSVQLQVSAPQSSCDAEVAVSGITTPLQSVVIHNALGNFERSTDADQSGRFCFAVSLTAGFNQFTVLAVDGSMQPLMQRSVTIEQSGCQGTSPNEAQANLVAGRYPTTDLSINGQLSALTDDDPKTSVELRGGLPWADAAGWVMIDLQRRIEVEMLQIDWRDSLGSGARYGRRFMILVRESDQYNKPSLDTSTWQILREVEDGKGGTQQFAVDRRIQKVALWLRSDAVTWDVQETFALAGIALYEKTTAKTPTRPSAICNQ
jgi:hypothetical protein